MSSLIISTDPEKLDLAFIHRYLSEQSYWAKGMRATTLRKALANSLHLMQAILQHPDLVGVTVLLHTNDAHNFYEKFGFFKPSMPERQMLRRL